MSQKLLRRIIVNGRNIAEKNSYSLREVQKKIIFQCQRKPRSSKTLTNKNIKGSTVEILSLV